MIDRKLVVTQKNDKIYTFLLQENRLIEANIFRDEHPLLHSIRIGKVKNIVKNIQAAFIEIAPGQMAYLSLEDCKCPIITNRTGDNLSLREGDEVVVQVVKEALKTKDPVVTTKLSFTGKYCVISTGDKHLGFSNKLSKNKKKHLRELLEDYIANSNISSDYGVIIRTNAGFLEDTGLLLEEVVSLQDRANQLLGNASYRTCYSVLYQEEKGYLRKIMDTSDKEYEMLTTDSHTIYDELQECAKNDSSLSSKITFYTDSFSLWKLHALETKLEEALQKKVWLKSGGYLIIEPTEALTVIDVNTGKYSGKLNKLDDTAYKINEEAAIEIALQLRLRNISGIIIVDFINMKNPAYEEKLLSVLRTVLKEDRIQTTLVDITPLGLVEITRKKVEKSLREQWGL